LILVRVYFENLSYSRNRVDLKWKKSSLLALIQQFFDGKFMYTDC
jgi:hypothetical protein